MKYRHIISVILALAICTPTSAFAQWGRAAKWAAGILAGWAAYEVLSKEDVETTLKKEISSRLSANKQKLFDAIHPTGKAKEVRLHSVSSKWKTSKPKSLKDLQGYTVVYTIFWEGPIIEDGYTKVASYFDADVDRFTGTQVLATNGITNSDAAEMITSFCQGFIGGLSAGSQ